MRPLLIFLVSIALLIGLFFFFMGLKPSNSRKEIVAPIKTKIDSLIQEKPEVFPYSYVDGAGYVLKDKQVVYFGEADTTEARKQEIIDAFQAELEAYWKWEILLGNKSLTADSSNVNRNEVANNDSPAITDRVTQLFDVSDLIKVSIDTVNNCKCDNNFILLTGNDLHLIRTNPNPDGGGIGSGPPHTIIPIEDLASIPLDPTNVTKIIAKGANDGTPSSTDGKILVGIIDTGFNAEALNSGYFSTGLDYNFLNNTTDIKDTNPEIHGTKISRIIIQNAGKNDKIQLVGLKTFDENYAGDLYHNVCALIYAYKNNIKVVNASWGTYIKEPDGIFTKVLNDLKKKEMVLIASAGNDNLDIDDEKYWPACYTKDNELGSNVITVTSKSGTICQNQSKSGKYIDFTVRADANCMHDIPNSPAQSGSSFAAPYVTSEVIKYFLTNPGIFNKKTFTNALIATPPASGISVYQNP